MRQRKVFIIGAGGMVGSAAAQALAVKEAVRDIVLIDVAEDLVRGQAMDINHGTAYTNGVHVRVGDYSEIQEDDIIVITCGLSQTSGGVQTRLDLLEANVRILKDVVGKVMAQGKLVYLLLVTNPVDILTYIALKTSGLPKERVLGSGTTLDTARLCVTLANRLHVSQQDVRAYILGEHGNSSFPALSSANIGGVPLQQFPGFHPEMLDNIEDDIRRAAYQIIEAKKSTYYGIGHTVANLVEALLRERASIHPVCSLAEGEYGLDDIAIGLPSLVGAHGVRVLDNYPLNSTELEKLHQSAAVLRQAMQSVQD